MLFSAISYCSYGNGMYYIYSCVGSVILDTAESTMPWVYCYLPMNHVEERLSRLHFWIWERHSILLVMACCWNVFINWIFAVLTFIGSPQWLCPASKVQSFLLWTLLIYVNDMVLQIQNGSLLQFADNICLICYGGDHISGVFTVGPSGACAPLTFSLLIMWY